MNEETNMAYMNQEKKAKLAPGWYVDVNNGHWSKPYEVV